jgi:uncharacterized membrane protein YqhA
VRRAARTLWGAMVSGPDGEEAKREEDPAARELVTREEDVERFLAWSLRLAYIPVAVLLLAGLGAFVYGTALFIHSVGLVVDHPFPIRHQIGLFLEVIDLFLIGATLLISAVGFYELFIYEVHRDGSTRIPTWLHMRDLNDLKARVIAMIVLVVSVSFVETVVDSPSGQQVLDLGGGIAAVVVALTVFLRLGGHGSKSGPGRRE